MNDCGPRVPGGKLQHVAVNQTVELAIGTR